MQALGRSIAAALLASGALVADVAPTTFVAWAPGYPGTTEQAQESMDLFARGVEQAAGIETGRLGAVYFPDLDEGLQRLEQGDATLALVPLPLYLEFAERLELQPLAKVIQTSGEDEVWSIVARRGALDGPASLSGWQLAGMPGYSPQFVRRVALAGWGELPMDLEVDFNARVLSVLRKAVKGEPVAALLDRAQVKALGTLPFAADLEVVASSPPMVATLICRVGDRLPSGDAAKLTEALLRLHEAGSGIEALEAIRAARFAPLGEGELHDVERLYRGD